MCVQLLGWRRLYATPSGPRRGAPTAYACSFVSAFPVQTSIYGTCAIVSPMYRASHLAQTVETVVSCMTGCPVGSVGTDRHCHCIPLESTGVGEQRHHA
jgi:hypothetical protein